MSNKISTLDFKRSFPLKVLSFQRNYKKNPIHKLITQTNNQEEDRIFSKQIKNPYNFLPGMYKSFHISLGVKESKRNKTQILKKQPNIDQNQHANSLSLIVRKWKNHQNLRVFNRTLKKVIQKTQVSKNKLNIAKIDQKDLRKQFEEFIDNKPIQTISLFKDIKQNKQIQQKKLPIQKYSTAIFKKNNNQPQKHCYQNNVLNIYNKHKKTYSSNTRVGTYINSVKLQNFDWSRVAPTQGYSISKEENSI